jgi:hypothetical protein
MSSSLTEIELANAVSVSINTETITVELDDGRTISIPLSWYPRLLHGKVNERTNYRLIGGGSGIHWPDLNEDVSIEGLLAGHRSQESQASLERWLEERRES